MRWLYLTSTPTAILYLEQQYNNLFQFALPGKAQYFTLRRATFVWNISVNMRLTTPNSDRIEVLLISVYFPSLYSTSSSYSESYQDCHRPHPCPRPAPPFEIYISNNKRVLSTTHDAFIFYLFIPRSTVFTSLCYIFELSNHNLTLSNT